MPVFYTPDIAVQACLPPEEAAHCIKVLRLKTGDEIRLADGKGHFYRARISRAEVKNCEVEILEVLPQVSDSIGLHLAVAPTKNADRMEWMAEKLTEIGIDSLSFVRSSHSERKQLKTDRISKIAVAAMKQSERSVLPEIREMVDFEQWIQRDFEGQKFIAHCWPEDEKPFIKEVYCPGKPVLLLIGPEGDFSREEVALAKSLGFKSISLGNIRLRTETAAFFAATVVRLANM
ncbi:MAG: 16S rRNA (uracil(1498)-N(3))-methyltransferase [Bacteroidales bacterium]|jgi:16S rRNA (uracil1498-N3)-methyltransferase|nr:16S rRNA (uracil(1498)-N(3))-methyltransferase [Bacteroidales bacterium]MDD4429861.1 16S rRNA (uracil(1498)-N(3))-methyltransferase [Bacteroidales bacterium]